MILFNYQQNIVNKIIDTMREYKHSLQVPSIFIKGHTGTGKSAILSGVINAKTMDPSLNTDSCDFILTTNKHLRRSILKTLRKVSKKNPNIKIYSLDDIKNLEYLEPNSVVVANWQSVSSNDRDNLIATRNGALLDLFNETRIRGIKVTLTIDESHMFDTTLSGSLIQDIIRPSNIIFYSATPTIIKNNKAHGYNVVREETVDHNEARKHGLIKSSVESMTVKELDKYLDSKGSDYTLLTAGYEKLVEIDKECVKYNLNNKPVYLVRCKYSKVSKYIKYFTDKYNLSEDDFAYWYTGDKKKNIENDSVKNGVKILFFENAIATGYDLPTASVLTILDSIKGQVFSVQVIGRINRIIEPKLYDTFKQSKLLTTAYVFCNDSKLKSDIEDKFYYKTAKNDKKSNMEKLMPGMSNLYPTDMRVEFVRRYDYQDFVSNIKYAPYLSKEFIKELSLTEDSSLNFSKMSSFGYDFFGEPTYVYLVNGLMRIGVSKTHISNIKEVKRKIGESDLHILYYAICKNIMFEIKDESVTNVSRTYRKLASVLKDLFIELFDISEIDFLKSFTYNYSNNGKIKELIHKIVSDSLDSYEPERKELLLKKAKDGKNDDFFKIAEYRNYTENFENIRFDIGGLYGISKSTYNGYYIETGDNSGDKREKDFITYLNSLNSVKTHCKNVISYTTDSVSCVYSFEGFLRNFFPDYLSIFDKNIMGIFEVKGDLERKGDGRNSSKLKFLAKRIEYWNKTSSFTYIGGFVYVKNGQWFIDVDVDVTYHLSEYLKSFGLNL